MATRQRRIGKSFVWGAILLGLGACGDRIAPRIYDPGIVHEETGAFPLGEIGSFSGPDGAQALAFHSGFQRAIEECNAKGGAQGRRIELVVLDDRGLPTDTHMGVKRLSGPSGAVAIACSSSEECLKAAREAASELAVVAPQPGADAQARGYATAQHLLAVFERVPKILPPEVAAELAAGP
ncbi:MAG: ABC transporter substrate-binding protein [Planctomycetes bacterium]|nr:ABC transporter substrate-binding protein [Planctomycetota bacterium]